MNKKIWRMVRLIIIIACVALLVKVVPIAITGYDMYQDAIQQTSIPHKIEQLKTDETYVTIDAISPIFLEQVIQSEDRLFYDHIGINLISTARAMLKNISAGSTVEGGSSITQQLAKNMYFSFEKRYERKVAELFVAFDLESLLEKEDILELYCNIAYFGEGCYGIKEATNHYYGVEPIEMTEEQASVLVHTLKSPNSYNPNKIQ